MEKGKKKKKQKDLKGKTIAYDGQLPMIGVAFQR